MKASNAIRLLIAIPYQPMRTRTPNSPKLFHKSLILSTCCFILSGAPLCAGNGFELRETEATIEIRSAGTLLLCYNKLSPEAPEGVKAIYERTGFLHPVCSPAGHCVTASFPFDHPHQQGIFSAWVKTRHNGADIDFWNLAKGTGRVLHHQVVETFAKDSGTGFVVDLVHRSERDPKLNILTERWRINAVPTDGSFHCFDLETKQQILTSNPLRIAKYHYGGVAIRGPVAWLTGSHTNTAKATTDQLAPTSTGFSNSLDSDRLKGNHERPDWVTMWGDVQGQPVGITVMCDKSSYRFPQSTRLHPTKPYFCFCPCMDGAFVIDQEHPYKAKYRFLITDTKPDNQWLRERWLEFTKR